MNEEKRDRRVKYTKQQLRNSIIELLGDKPLYKISIKEICEKADINRSTFYAHYETQYDLYDEIVRETAADIVAIANTFPKKRSAIETVNLFRDILTYVEEHREFCLVLLSDKGNLTVGETLNTIFASLRTVDVYPTDGVDNYAEFDSYISLFVLSGTASILWKWLNTENRIPAEELARLICGISLRGLRAAARVRSSGKKLDIESAYQGSVIPKND